MGKSSERIHEFMVQGILIDDHQGWSGMARGFEGWAWRTTRQPMRVIVQNTSAAVDGGASSWTDAMQFVRIS
jgi:hypothetical protein